MELRHLRYFLAVAEEKHITRAAERLGMQQPPLSQQIKALEAEIGIQLFRRVPRGVELTSGGAAFLQEVRGILSGVEHAVIKASRAAHGLEGTLLVGFSTSAIAHRLVPDLIRAYRQAYPGVALDLSGGNAAELTEAVAKGAIHAAIFRKPVVQPADVIFHSLLEEEMLAVLPLEHPLLEPKRRSKAQVISLRALADEEFILVRQPGAAGMYADLVAACHKVGFTPKIAVEVSDMLTNITLVGAAIGVSVVPASMRGFHGSRVAYCKLEDADTLVAPISLAYRQTEADPVALHFVALALGRHPPA
jgi:DNA-binding transcriptional LysR family regulator